MKKYSKNEAKEAAKEMLQGVWTALPTNFTPDDKIDEAAMAWNLEYCISELKLEGHYCHGNVAEFWTHDQRRAHAHPRDQRGRGQGPRAADRRLPPSEPERSDQAREPCAGGRHRLRDHPDAVRRGARRRQRSTSSTSTSASGSTSASCSSTPKRRTRSARRSRSGSRRSRTSARSSRACRRSPRRSRCAPPSARSSRSASPTKRRGSTTSRVMGDHWLLNYCPHLYQVPGYLPVNDYTAAAQCGRLQQGDRDLAQPESAAHRALEVDPRLRRGRRPHARARAEILDGADRHERRPGARAADRDDAPSRSSRCAAELEATGLADKAKAGPRKGQRRAA